MNSTSDIPDFQQGIELAALPEGSIIKGRFGETEVILVRSGGNYFALEAQCTHMGAPLADGAVIENCVHCPWHHARFSLATGQAVAAPAFSALKRYQTRVRDERIFVVGPLPDEKPVVGGDTSPRVVVVGTGAAGYACAELLSRRGAGARVTLIGKDPDGSYDRTMCSKQYLIGMAKRQETELPDLPDEVTQITAKVDRIDARNKRVVLSSGEVVAFDALVLATGAVPRRLERPGFDRPNVFTLRSLGDADAIIEAARGAKHVAVIGASFIGLEVAASLRQRQLEVTVIAPDKIPLEKIVGADVGTMIRHVHEEKGVRFLLGHEARRFDDGRVHLDHGASVEAELVVMGLGVTPDTRLAETAGANCAAADQGGGIIVDEFLATSVPGIFAVGDVASYPDVRSGKRIRVEHWVHAQRQGQYLARALLGENGRFTDVPFFWSAHFDTGLLYVGRVSHIVAAETEGSIEGRSFTRRLSGVEPEAAFLTCNRDLPALLIEADWEHRKLAK